MKSAAAIVALLASRIADCGLRIDCGLPRSGPQSAPFNPQSAIPNPQSKVRNPQPAIRNDSALRTPRSAIAEFDRARVLAAADEFLTKPPRTSARAPRSAGGPHDFFSGKAAYIDVWKTLKADSGVEEVVRNFFVRQPLLWPD
jgi:hypothetical protein